MSCGMIVFGTIEGPEGSNRLVLVLFPTGVGGDLLRQVAGISS